jgi:hypothetical protein
MSKHEDVIDDILVLTHVVYNISLFLPDTEEAVIAFGGGSKLWYDDPKAREASALLVSSPPPKPPQPLYVIVAVNVSSPHGASPSSPSHDN